MLPILLRLARDFKFIFRHILSRAIRQLHLLCRCFCTFQLTYSRHLCNHSLPTRHNLRVRTLRSRPCLQAVSLLLPRRANIPRPNTLLSPNTLPSLSLKGNLLRSPNLNILLSPSPSPSILLKGNLLRSPSLNILSLNTLPSPKTSTLSRSLSLKQMLTAKLLLPRSRPSRAMI